MEKSPFHFQSVYSADVLEETFKFLGEKLKIYLENCQKDPAKIFYTQSPKDLFQTITCLLENPEGALKVDESAEFTNFNFGQIEERLDTLLNLLFQSARPMQSPHTIGHQVSAPLPFAGAMDAVIGVLNQSAAVFELGPFLLSAERVIVKKLAKYISSHSHSHFNHKNGEGFEGIVTHGGTLANLTGLLCARNLKLTESFSQGVMGQTKPAIMTSGDAHYSISRAAGVMGIGGENVLKVPIDPITRKIETDQLESFYQEKIKEGYQIFALVGSACSTPTGAIDDLEALGQFCQRHNLWFHVDAAHGGGLLLSPKYRSQFKGIELADTLTWDAHKMMFVPSLCTFLFFKRKEDSYKTFSQTAPYLFDPQMSDVDFEGGLRTFECTKRTLILPLLTIMATLGEDFLGILVEKVCDTTQLFYRLLQDHREFQPLHRPEANILCFTVCPEDRPLSLAEANLLQDRVRQKLLAEGDYYITGTTLDEKRCLRVTVMHPLTGEKELKELMKKILALAKKENFLGEN